MALGGRGRRAAAAGFDFLTGNYTFFNLLTMSLCVFLFDDRVFGNRFWERMRVPARTALTSAIGVGAAAIVVLVLSASELEEMFFETSPSPENALVRIAGPFQIANTYGLFASMTTTRPEIIVQGSSDGVTWLDYEFPL